MALINQPNPDWGLEQLKLLFEYTKMHIGLYTGVATAFAAAISSKDAKFNVHRRWIFGAIACICAAGFAGGVVASSIPQFHDIQDFWNTSTGPFVWPCLMPGRYWTYLEHLAFWMGVVCAGLAVALGKDRE